MPRRSRTAFGVPRGAGSSMQSNQVQGTIVIVAMIPVKDLRPGDIFVWERPWHVARLCIAIDRPRDQVLNRQGQKNVYYRLQIVSSDLGTDSIYKFGDDKVRCLWRI